MMSRAVLASPGGSAPFQGDCNHRPEFTKVPACSAKQLVGKRNTSVWICDGSTSLYSPTLRQNSEVSVTSGSLMIRNFSLEKPSISLALLGAAASGLKPWQM